MRAVQERSGQNFQLARVALTLRTAKRLQHVAFEMASWDVHEKAGKKILSIFIDLCQRT